MRFVLIGYKFGFLQHLLFFYYSTGIKLAELLYFRIYDEEISILPEYTYNNNQTIVLCCFKSAEEWVFLYKKQINQIRVVAMGTTSGTPGAFVEGASNTNKTQPEYWQPAGLCFCTLSMLLAKMRFVIYRYGVKSSGSLAFSLFKFG